MAITLAKLYTAAKKTYHMKLLAGSAGMQNYVRWVHMIEDMQVPSFLHGDELVFTTGIGQSGTVWLQDFAKLVYQSKGAGLVVNIGPYIHAVPPQVVVFCEQHGLPLFQVPWEVHLIDITYDFCHRIVSNEESEMSLANAFRGLIYGTQEWERLYPTLKQHGFIKTDLYCVAVFSVEHKNNASSTVEKQKLYFQAHKLLEKMDFRFSLFYQENVLIVIQSGSSPHILQEFAKNLIELSSLQFPKWQIHAGIGPQSNGLQTVSDSFRKAMAALRLAQHRSTPCLQYEGLGVYKLLLAVDDSTVLEDFVQETLSPLKTFDTKNGTDYIHTLHTYIEHNSSVQELSKISGLHRNTINYKIKRIRKILQCNLTQKDKLRILLAFYIEDLLQKKV